MPITVGTTKRRGRIRGKRTTTTARRSPIARAVEGYIEGVLNGTVIAGELIRLAVKRHLLDLQKGKKRGLYFDEQKASDAIEFFSYLKHSKGEWAGQSFQLEPWQQFIVWCIFGWIKKDGTRRFKTAYLEVPRKNGKALDVGTLVLTTKGWARHGDLRPGDAVFGPDGLPHLVTAVSGQYMGPCYRLTFSDGSTIDAHARHEWETRRTWYTGRKRGSRQAVPLVETYQIASTLRCGARGDYTHGITVARPIQMPPAEMTIPPYTLGAWLGDGHSAGARLTCMETEIVDRIAAEGITVKRLGVMSYSLGVLGRGGSAAKKARSLQGKLRALGVLRNKHIPPAYLHASDFQRRALLAGIMDTDGHITARGQCEIVLTHKPLFDGVVQLLMTLGYKPTQKTDVAKLNGREIGPRYRVQFWGRPDDGIVSLKRKAARLIAQTGRRSRCTTRMITGAQPIGDRMVNCIEVEGGRYLAGPSLIATHNSTLGAGIGLKLAFADNEPGAEVYCLDPSTRVLDAELRWRTIDGVKPGDRLLGFDERPAMGTGKYRKARYCTVVGTRETVAPARRLTFSNGQQVVCSHNHRWLMRRYRSASNLGWRRAGDLKVGDLVRHLGKPWDESDIPPYDAGYLAGVFDGEGYFHSPTAERSAFRIGFSQKEGLVLDKVFDLLVRHGFDPTIPRRGANCHYLEIGGLHQVLRFLGNVRPVRLHARHAEIWEGRALNRSLAHLEVTQIEELPAQRLVDIETTTGTFFAEGLFSHNSAATKKDQAIIVHGEATRMVKASPDLIDAIQVYKNSLTRLDKAQKYEPLGADEDTLDGLNVHAAIVDELHAHKTRGVYDLMETGTSARRQPLLFAITTAGTDQTDASICWEQHVYVEQILRGVIQDDTYFGFICAMDEKDDWQNERNWFKANPNLGVSKKLDYMRDQAQKAANMPSKLNTFLRLDLNKWTQQVTRWIDLGLWDKNAGAPIIEAEFQGKPCYAGLDLSSVSDLTAFVLLFPDATTGIASVLCRFWCPESRLTDEHNRYRDQYQAWEREGWITATPGNAIDYEAVKAQVLQDAQTFQMQELAVDRLFQGYQMSMQLAEEGLTVAACGMGFMSMAGPTAELERRLLSKGLRHGGNPVLRWMANNVAVKQDPAGNKKPDKAQSQGKIDGIVALLLALDRDMRHQITPSIYETRGLTTLGGANADTTT